MTIFHLDDKFQLLEKISSDKVNIKNYSWEIDQAQIFRLENSIFTSKKVN